MSEYHKSEIKAVMPFYGLETYTVKIQIFFRNACHVRSCVVVLSREIQALI